MEGYGFLIVIILASFLQGITGFGSALIAAPLALLFVDKTTAIIALMFASIALNGYLLWRVRGVIDMRQFRLLFFASLVGLPLGLMALRSLDIDTLRIVAGSFSLVFAVLLYAKPLKAARAKSITALAGLFSGVLHTSIGMSGPPVVLLLAGQRAEKDNARRTFAAFFLVMSVVSIGLFAATGTVTHHGLVLGLLSVPGAILGAYAGAKIARYVSQRQFTFLVLALVCITGLLTIYSGVTN